MACSKFWKKSKRHRTATTAYPCSLPDLGDSAGAGRAACNKGKDICFIKKSAFVKIFWLGRNVPEHQVAL